MKFLCSLVFFFLVASCTVTKRVHRPGWHVQWKKHHQTENVHEAVQSHSGKIEEELKGEMVSAVPEKEESIRAVQVHKDRPSEDYEDMQMEVPMLEKIKITGIMTAAKMITKQTLDQEDGLRMFDDRKSFSLLLLGLTILLIGVVVLLAVPSIQVEIVALQILLLITGAFLTALSFLMHSLWKREQRKEEREKSYRTTRERKRRALWVVVSIFGTIAMLGITLYLATLVGEFLVAGIIFLIACTIMSSLLFEQYVKGWSDQTNRISPKTERALILLFVSVAITVVVLVLFALNGWLLIPAASGLNLGFAVAATILGFGALIVALVGMGTLVEALDW